MKKHNFSAGPAILPAPVLKEAAKGVANYQGIELSLLELSHRGPEFMAIIEEATALVRDMRENFGVFCSIVAYPVIPKGMLILRLIPTAMHTDEDIRITLDAFTAVRVIMQSGIYKQFIPEVLI